MVGLVHPVVAYWFDDAVAWFGDYVEEALKVKDESGRHLYSMDSLLGIEPEPVVVNLG